MACLSLCLFFFRMKGYRLGQLLEIINVSGNDDVEGVIKDAEATRVVSGQDTDRTVIIKDT